jgi:hypothetical protein
MNAPKQDHESKPNGEEAPLPAVSANTLARCIGVTPKVVYDLTKAAIIERGSSRLYPLEDSVRRYCDHLRRQTEDRVIKSEALRPPVGQHQRAHGEGKDDHYD